MKATPTKRRFTLLLILATLLAAGCTKEYFERADELRSRVDALQVACETINRNLNALQNLILAIQEKDMITGITEIKENGVSTGYKINFVNHDPVTISNGKDGNTPIISSKYDSEDGNYYWTVQYGNGNVEWMLDPEGNKLLSTGILPYLAIRDGVWCYTLDGTTYIEIGKADGESGDKLFAGFDTQSSDYVIITLASGQKLKIPTYAAYLSLREGFETINRNASAQAEIIRAAIEKITYLTGVTPILSGTDTIGTAFMLNTGKKGEIYDWSAPMTPVIFAKKDTDGQLYWAYEFGNLGVQWVLDPDGNKISASSEPAEAPQVDVTLADDGNWYWVVTYKGKTELLRFPVGDGYAPHAIDSASNSAFSSVVNTATALVVTLKDGKTTIALPKQYTVEFTYEDGTAVGDTLTMKMVSGGDTKLLRYQAFGPQPQYTIIGEGGFSARQVLSYGQLCFEIHSPAIFQDGKDKLMIIFTFGNASPTSVVRTFYFKREE